MKKHILSAHRALTQIFSEGTYSNLALGGDASDMSVRLTMGVLENNIRIEYTLSQLFEKKPQNAVYILLKIGVYALENLKNVPKYAIVSECVEAAKSLGKSGAKGFVNAVLKAVSDGRYSLPKQGEENYFSVTYSKPQWFVDKVFEEFERDEGIKILSAKSQHMEHIRVNLRLSSADNLLKNFPNAKKSEVGGLIVDVGNDKLKEAFNSGLITYQSPSSMLAVQALAPASADKTLDICSAPGGKAVYISELSRDGSVTACELHPHRIKLIESYKKRMKADNIAVVQADATKLNPEWLGRFDKVLVDAPCSCLGTFLKHPDVFLQRKREDIAELADTQKKIINNAAKYLKSGGVLIYSTCTLFHEENKDVSDSILDSGFRYEHIEGIDEVFGGKFKDNRGFIQLLPDEIYDGFYIARLRKV